MITFPTEEIMVKYKLFWQYPVITEKKFFLQNNQNTNFTGIPWATIIDKRYNINIIYNLLKPYFTNLEYYTCCQHISFRNLLPLFKALNITTVYTPHKVKGEDVIDGIVLKPCPLYAVNLEDKNKVFNQVDLENIERKYLYTFAGGYQSEYLTKIRLNIFDMVHPENTKISNTGEWHFNSVVYDNKQNADGEMNIDQKHIDKTENYNKLLLESRYTLAPSGSGPNSIRFWEALGAGSIPVLLADTLELPSHELWEKSIVRVLEKDVEKIPDILRSISVEEERERRTNCLKLYEYFRGNYRNVFTCKREIIHYCCGSYFKGFHGGVARYDYQISLAFPNYKHFTGPQEKGQLLEYLKNCNNPLVITDNHLSIDIPNTYDVLLVHHGCAMTTSIRNPEWEEPWKSLCTTGQNKMLDFRDVKKTKIISISQSCTDDFIHYYGEKYNKFNRVTILHSSELDESEYKTKFNNNPIVLGNWVGLKKGQRLIQNLKENIKNFTFQQLSVNIDSRGINSFNKRKQDIYLKADIFLQISNSEGNSYATLDALLCGLPIVSSNVGLFYEDVPEDCFVKIPWEKNNDAKYVEEKLKFAWKHREELGKKARKWYLENCRFDDWKKKMCDL